MDFERSFSEKDIQALESHELFTQFIRPDCVEAKTNKQVFPAVRKGRLDFYHAGGKVFTFKRTEGFTTHQKYASVLACPEKQHYVSEGYIGEAPPIRSFIDPVKGAPNDFVYKRIKENCAAYAGDEARCVSYLYSEYSCAKTERKSPIVVLDIEISFEKAGEIEEHEDQPSTNRKRNGQDRIDLLLFHRESGVLRFVEAKLFENNEIHSKGTPKVLDQLRRYREQIAANSSRILDQYQRHVDVLNALFSCDLPQPISLDPEPSLFIVGFDKDQKLGRLKSAVEKLQNNDILQAKVYPKGEPKDVDIEVLWRTGDPD